MHRVPALSPFADFDRPEWAALAGSAPVPLTHDEVASLASLGDEVDIAEVREVYQPMSRLLGLHVQAEGGLHRAYQEFLRRPQPHRTPFVIGIAGSVSVGKSTTARLLRLLLARSAPKPTVELVATDGFLFPNAELVRRGILGRKGYPESYDRRELLHFLTAVKSASGPVDAPVYSHLTYDIVPGARQVVDAPHILILEGLNVLQPAQPGRGGRTGLAVGDFIDFSIYVDAAADDIRRWYVHRFLRLRDTAFRDPASFFRRYAELDQPAAVAEAERIWDEINGPNLEQNILPTRGRATLVLTKGGDHAATGIRLRKV